MTNLVLTVVGDDRAGLVQALADTVAAHGGNWERSELAELAGAFAGIVLVSVPDGSVEALTAALGDMRGLLHVTPHAGAASAPPVPAGDPLTFTIIGNDRPGIVREVTSALARHGVSIDRFSSATVDAPMSGGQLFEATVTAHAQPHADTAAATAELERLAGEIQVDLTVG